MSKREIERRRAQKRKVLIPAIAVGIMAAGLAGVIILSPMLTPPASTPPPGARQVTNTPMHIHVELAIYQGAQKATIPEDIGRNPARWLDHSLDGYLLNSEGAVGDLSPLHTHDTSGTIHIESSVTTAFTLGEFFAVWGQPIGPDRVVNLVRDANHTLTMTVNGVNDEEWGSLVLVDQQQIEIHYDPI